MNSGENSNSRLSRFSQALPRNSTTTLSTNSHHNQAPSISSRLPTPSSNSALSLAASVVSTKGSSTKSYKITANASSKVDIDAEASQDDSTIVRRATPILFSTNRGLHLRTALAGALQDTTALSGNACGLRGDEIIRRRLRSASAYDIKFCDLERWSTNQANSVCLEDSIIGSRTFTVSHSPHRIFQAGPTLSSESSVSSKHSAKSLIQHSKNNGSSSFLPIKRSVVRFNNTLYPLEDAPM